MKATSPELEALLLHLSGRQQLQIPGDFGDLLARGAGLREPFPAEFLDSFGKREFYAAVGFIDMVGFSEQARDKSPSEVKAVVAPFIESVVRAATDCHCFVDKTIGDEVMVVRPFPLSRKTHYDLLNYREQFDIIYWFLTCVAGSLEHSAPHVSFAAAVGFGTVMLDEIRVGSYSEWTVYGNSVNGAKRLHTIKGRDLGGTAEAKYWIVIGAPDSEQPHFVDNAKRWLAERSCGRSSLLQGASIDCQSLKGVGRMCYLAGYLKNMRMLLKENPGPCDTNT